MKRVLIVSPHFPPVNAPDCQRVRMSLPYYRRYGWEPEVLAVRPEHRADWRDDSLLAGLPADIPLHYCQALPASLTRFVGVHNMGLRSVPFINARGLSLLREARFDLIFFSTTQYLVTPLGRLWLRRTGIPYVVDLQDPWRSDYYERAGAPPPPGGWKYQFARLTAWLFEEQTFRDAAGFISVSHHYLRELSQRYRWFSQTPQVVIPFGGPQADFDYLAAHPAPCSLTLAPDDCIHFVAAGSLGPPFSHALRVLFAALRQLRDESPALAERLRFHFIGTSYAPPRQTRPVAQPIAAAYGVGDLVREQTSRIGYLDSLRLMQQSDIILLLGTDDLTYSPSKIYPSTLTGRPMLALAHHGSLLHGLVRGLRCAKLFTLLEPGRETAPTGLLVRYLTEVASRRDADFDQPAQRLAPIGPAGISAENGARRQCEFFDAALARTRRP